MNDDDNNMIMNSIGIGDTSSTSTIPKTQLQDNANSILFSELSDIFKNISMAKVKKDALEKYLFNKNLVKRLDGQSIYPLLRLVLPSCTGPQNETQKFNIGLKQLAGFYVNILHVAKDSDNYKALYLMDNGKNNITSGDTGKEFGTALESILNDRISVKKSTKTIGEVNEILLSIKIATNVKKQEIIEKKIYKEFSATEQKWLARIMYTQDLKIGLTPENVLSKMSLNAHANFQSCMNLKTVCEAEDGKNIYNILNYSFLYPHLYLV
jgi:hypothetical protein